MDSGPPDAPPTGATAPAGDRLLDAAPGFEAEVSSLRPHGAPPRHAELGGPRLSRRQRLMRVGALTALVAAALLTLTAPLYGPSLRALLTPHAPPPLVIRIARDGLGCVQAVVWSSDGRTLAVAGSDLGCGDGAYLPGQINLYDARSGRLLARWHPDAAVLAALHATIPSVPLAPQTGGSDLLSSYDQALWSPDGQSLAVTLFIVPNPQAGGTPVQGLLLLDRDGTHPRVLLHAWSRSAPDLVAWDLAQSAPVLGTAPADAAAYVWGSGGALSAVAALGNDQRLPAVAPSGPIGDPDGGGSFTAWQSGELLQSASLATDSTPLPEPYLWFTSFLAWSPDGRYLSVVPRNEALVVPIYPDTTQLPTGAFGEVQTGVAVAAAAETPPPGALQPALPYVRARDRAMSDLAQTQLSGSNGGWALAWRRDGRVLAAFGPRTGAVPPLTLYDTATGREMGALEPVSDAGNLLAGQNDILRWSPDGTRLLLYSSGLGTICIWGPAQLPA